MPAAGVRGASQRSPAPARGEPEATDYMRRSEPGRVLDAIRSTLD